MNKNNNIFDVGGRVLETKYSRITKVELLEISLLTGQNFIDEKMKSEIQIEFEIDEKNYLNNPIICFDHNWSKPPIGKVLKMKKKKGILEIDVQFSKDYINSVQQSDIFKEEITKLAIAKAMDNSKDFKKYFGGDSLMAFYGECCVHSDGDVDFDENRARGFLLSHRFAKAFYNSENSRVWEMYLCESSTDENLFVYLKDFLK